MGSRLACFALLPASTCHRFSPTTYEPLQLINEGPGVEQFTYIIDATMHTGTAASPALASIATQHPSAIITELPDQSYVAKEHTCKGVDARHHRMTLTLALGRGGSSFPERACPRAVRSAGRACRGGGRW